MYQSNQQKTKAEMHIEELQRQAQKEQNKTKRLAKKIEEVRTKNERPR
jgi:hypothetical protein